MAKYDRGCVKYISREYTVTVHFPEDKVICDLCPFCRAENAGTRFRCNETAEILPYHNVGYGLRCPLFKDDPIKNVEIEEE